jgi:hypothetical protein
MIYRLVSAPQNDKITNHQNDNLIIAALMDLSLYIRAIKFIKKDKKSFLLPKIL